MRSGIIISVEMSQVKYLRSMLIAGEEIRNLSPEQEEKIQSLQGLYEFWNSRINVISRKDMNHFLTHHILHSLSIAMAFDFRNNPSVLDLGCGGGFPGIPLAIYFPDIHFHLIDSIGKKIKVVQAVSKELKLDNVSGEQIRAENIRNRKFDAVVSRAVAPLSTLIGWSFPLMKKKNASSLGLICLKGGNLSQEIEAAGKQVYIREIYKTIFQDDWFRDKYILQVKL